MNERMTIPDAHIRHLAETTFDRNVVVIAGAGTGKTTLLVNRLIHALMRDPQPAKITEMVALTFTNKAATEMKIRLRERLLSFLDPDQDEREACDPGVVRMGELQTLYGLSSAQIVARAEAALHDLEKAQIGTLHSFAAHLLRLHPIESGVDPDFKEDDGIRFEEHFLEQWELWLDRELGANGQNHEQWRRLLAHVELTDLREFTFALCSELVPLDGLIRQVEDMQLSPTLRESLVIKHARTAELLTAHARTKPRKVEVLLAAARELFRLLLERGLEGIGGLRIAERDALNRDLGALPADWTESDFAEAGSLIRMAKRVCGIDPGFVQELLIVLTPFIKGVRATFLNQGWLSFDSLLARARALLRDHPTIRERLKHECHAMLVDEFQDTDPIQYEMILYLVEQMGSCHASWRDIELTPGKLFIVGDPKQSIYAFRRADIEAFDQVVNKIQASGGEVYELVTNFRSHGNVLGVVNAVFDRLFQHRENLQPSNVPLIVQPNRSGGVTRPGVELRLVKAGQDDDEFDVASATRIEADSLARWLSDELLAHETFVDAHGRKTPLKPGHIALVFRKLTQAQGYLEALRRHRIPYVTDGEKHFYRRQEVVDLVNLLRVVENPHDSIALLGVLRSPLGGVTDRELCELRERDAFDYRRMDRLKDWESPRASAVRRLYERFVELNRSAPLYPLPVTVDLLFTRLPILELAGASLDGEQAMANLIKVREMAAEFVDRPQLTFSGFVDLMVARLSEQREEAEGAVAEESLETVRVLTIHKAKGLEFPVVILPGLHHGVKTRGKQPLISQDWSTNLLGISIKGQCNLGAVLVGEKYRAREEAEQRRLLYVGMTRAKERLILSGGLTSHSVQGTFLALLQDVVENDVGEAEHKTIHVGPIGFDQTVTAEKDRFLTSRKGTLHELQSLQPWTDLILLWEQRDHRWSKACSRPRYLTPSLLMKQEPKAVRALTQDHAVPESGHARLIGTLAHRVLEDWDFTADPEKLERQVEVICERVGFQHGRKDAQEMALDLRRMFRSFAASDAYAQLRRATIVGREVPFAIPWDGSTGTLSTASDQPCVMEGIIDLLYQLDGQVWIADYKTDHLLDEEIPDRVARYRCQTQVYQEAVSRSLGVANVRWNLIFLRNGKSVEI